MEIKSTSPLYRFTYQEQRVSESCLALAESILHLISLNSGLVIEPEVDMMKHFISIEYDTKYGEFSLWVYDKDNFCVEWEFSVVNSDIYIGGICSSIEQILHICQNSVFGGLK